MEKDYIKIIEDLKLEIIPSHFYNEEGSIIPYWHISCDIPKTEYFGISLKKGIDFIVKEIKEGEN
jgi:hypothetical protein